MEVSGQLHTPAALPLRKDPLLSIGYEAEWALLADLTYYSRELKIP